ncbi:MAG: hypothetical protein ABJG88_03500 [Litorimonas sp.]
MLLLILSGFLFLGALSAQYKIIDLFMAVGFITLYGSVGLFFNEIYPEAPTIEAAHRVGDAYPLSFDAHTMISWILEHGSSTANLIMLSPGIYLGSKACSEIFRTVRKVLKTSAA